MLTPPVSALQENPADPVTHLIALLEAKEKEQAGVAAVAKQGA